LNAGTLIIGLGNPGTQYAGTRHNFGFLVADELFAQARQMSWQEKFGGQFCKFRLDNKQLTLLKPMTYMNLSGQCVSRVTQYFGYSPDQIIVVHDELDLPFGAYRIKKGGGTAGHKGLVSIGKEIGNNGFIRVRMGIGHPDKDHNNVSDYVLGTFQSEEETVLRDMVNQGANAVRHIVFHGVVSAMNELNKRNAEPKRDGEKNDL
jgi:PTH1 family peptidyl-tRNA hydrolase